MKKKNLSLLANLWEAMASEARPQSFDNAQCGSSG